MAVTSFLYRYRLSHYVFMSMIAGTVLIFMYNTDPSSHLWRGGLAAKSHLAVASSRISSVGAGGKNEISIDKQDISEWRKYISQLGENELLDLAERQIGPNNLTSMSGLTQFEKCGGYVFGQRSNSQYLHAAGMKATQYCSKMSFRKEGPIVALASFPGSGNSWVRQLIEKATGIYTGAVYCDFSYVEAGMIGEGITTGNVIVIKTHTSPWHMKFAKSVYILRNPFGAIVSEWTRRITPHTRYKSNHVTELGIENFGM